MARTMAIVNQKGGVGKSTTAVNLSAALAEQGQKILLVDIDPQGNTTSGVGVDKASLEQCIYNILVEESSVDEIVKETSMENLNLIPATIELAGAEIELVSSLSREIKLKQALENVQDSFDFIIIDCPPSLGLLTLNALTAAHCVLVPIQCEYYALEGLGQLMRTIQLVQSHLNADLYLEGVILTMYDVRTNLSQQVTEEVRKYFGEKVYNTIIPRNVRLSEAPSFGMPIQLYDPQSKGAAAYRSLAGEVLGQPIKGMDSAGAGR